MAGGGTVFRGVRKTLYVLGFGNSVYDEFWKLCISSVFGSEYIFYFHVENEDSA